MFEWESSFSITADDVRKLEKLRVPKPQREHLRLQVLRECNLLDTQENDQSYDRYVSLTVRYFHVPIALVSLVDV